MKRIVIALAAIIFVAAPALARVDITLAQVGDTNEIIISYDASTETNLVRAFALNIQLDNDANIQEVTGISSDYYIFLGTIQIDSQGNMTDFGTALADYNDLPSDTLPGIDSNGVTIEMASLYAPVGPGSPNAPAKTGDLLSIIISGGTCMTITANVSRAGSTGVVMEDPNQVVTVNLPIEYCPVTMCAGCTPNCWDNVNQCAGQQQGDATCDGAVNLGDLIALKAAWGASAPWTAPFCCADFDHSGAVNLGDLITLKASWGGGPYAPSTGNQDCP